MSDDAKRPLGKILLQKKLVSQQDLDAALRAQKRSADPQPLASRLAESGALDEMEALRALSDQHGVPGIDLGQIAILLEHLLLIPREVSETRLFMCVLARGERLFLAMANPQDRRILDELEFVTGRKVFPYVALTTPLKRTIAEAYDAAARSELYYLGPRVPAETLRQLGLASPPGAPSHGAAPAPHSAPAVPPASRAVMETRTPIPASVPRASAQLVAGDAPGPAPARKAPSAKQQAAVPGSADDAFQADRGEESDRLSIAMQPGSPGIVVDEAIAAAGLRAELAPADFGNLASETSQVGPLPDDPQMRRGAAGAQGKRVLIVEDEGEIRRMLATALLANGYRVLEADRGQLALRIVKEHVPDALLLDAMLPEIHGFDIARRIKGSERYGHIPIVMISAVYKGWRIADDLKASYGIDAYLEKPFKVAEVLATLERVLTASKSHTAGGAPARARDPEALHEGAEAALKDGIAAYKRGEIDFAIGYLRRGIEIDPLSYRLHFHLALLFGRKGMIYEGIQELERAVDLNPMHFAAQKNLAALYEKAGFKHKAVEVYTRCVQIAPDAETRAAMKEHLFELL